MSTIKPSGIWPTQSPYLQETRKQITRTIQRLTPHKVAKQSQLANEIGIKEYLNILRSFFEELAYTICADGVHVKLPLNMGTIGIVRRKNKQRFVSVLDSAKTGEFVWRKNFHTGDYRVYLLWDRKTYKFASPKFIQEAFKLRLSSKMKVLMADHAARLGLINIYHEHV